MCQRWRCRALRRVCVVPSQSPVKTFKGIVVGVLTSQRHRHGGKGSSRGQQGVDGGLQEHCGILETGVVLSGVAGSPQSHQCGAHRVAGR